MSKSSYVAMFAAAGMFVGGVALPSAQAADLGGDCCADLEERVAELEATTARKGNRRMSLTISGQVTREIMYWSADVPGAVGDSGTYAGLDNHNQSSRFTFSGSARISPNLQAGFEFMTEWAVGARTSSVDQNSPDGNGAGLLAGDATLAVRTANWWLEDKNLGRVTVGRLNVGGPVGTIDLGGISTVAHFSPGLAGGGFIMDAVGGNTRLGALVGPTYGGDRIEGIRYDSPNLGGFVFQGSWGEADVWSASVRYAGEFAGFRVAAGIGYEAQNGNAAQPIQLDTGSRPMDNEWAASLAVMHVASGLFAQGHYARSEFFNDTDANFWMVQGGITKNYTGLGNTSFYGEYGVATNYVQAVTGPLGDSEVNFYGIGVVQQIDAAAMELYLGWRRFDASGDDGNAFDSSLDLVRGGARIRF